GTFSQAITFTATDGNKNIVVEQTDAAGNTGSANRTFIKDDTDPGVVGSLDDGTTYSSITQSPAFTWTAASDGTGSGVAKYELAIGSGTSGAAQTDELNWTDIGNVLTYQAGSLTLAANTTYYVSVRAVDGAGNTGAVVVSDGWTTGGIPAAFNITGATGGTDNTANAWLGTTTTLTANWDAATGATAYDVVVRNSGDTDYAEAGDAVACAENDVAATSYTFTGCTLVDGTSYIIKVTAKNGVGNRNATNNSYSFTVDTTPPAVFTIAGIRGGTDVTTDAWLTNGSDATVYWNDTTGETGYTVSVQNTALNTTYCSDSGVTADTNATALSPCSLANTNTYTAVVVARDAAGNTRTATFNFTVDTSAPAIAITSPAANTYGQTGVTVAGTCEGTYTINISGTGHSSPATTTCSGGTFSVAVTFSGTDGTKNIVVAQTDEGGLTGSANRDFIKDDTDPTAPGTPNDGATHNSAAETPTVTWTASTDTGGSGIASYEFAIGSTSGATDVLTWTDITNVTSYQRTGLTLTNNEDYFVSVRAVDVAGNRSPASTSDGWTVQTAAGLTPDAFMMTGIQGGADTTTDEFLTDSAALPKVMWNDTTGETSYTVAVHTYGGAAKCTKTAIAADSTSYQFVAGDNCGSFTFSPATTYQVVVTAVGSGGNTSAINASASNKYVFTATSATLTPFQIIGVSGGSDTTADPFLDDAAAVNAPKVTFASSGGAANYDIEIKSTDGATTFCSVTNKATTDSGMSTSASGGVTYVTMTFGGANACTSNLVQGTDYKLWVTARTAGGTTTTAYNNQLTISVVPTSGARFLTCTAGATNSSPYFILRDQGNMTGTYSSADCSMLVNPNDATKQISWTFSYYRVVDTAGDTMTIYDNNAASGTQLLSITANYDSTVSGNPALSGPATSGNSYLNWVTDGSGHTGGWEVAVKTELRPLGTVLISGVRTQTSCTASATESCDTSADNSLTGEHRSISNTSITDFRAEWSYALGSGSSTVSPDEYQVYIRNAGDSSTLCAATGLVTTSRDFNDCPLVSGSTYKLVVYAIKGSQSIRSEMDFSVDFSPGAFTISGVSKASATPADSVVDAFLVDTTGAASPSDPT
ncbi:MAG TPA: fibronectin type III domain-containing protein, partial [Bdellovibrionales bacterium]|nr:fibronectin type III domain-containing protein [Bdellovibrionales bacterium]